MSSDRIVLISCWMLIVLLLIITIPRDKIREAQLVFLFKQVLTWILGILVAQYHLIVYPVREFPNATNTSFSFEYFIYPATCVIFVLRFPEGKGMIYSVGWYLFFPTWMTILEVLIELNTHLIRYIHWSWYWTWISLLVTLFISRHYFLWFTKKGIINGSGIR